MDNLRIQFLFRPFEMPNVKLNYYLSICMTKIHHSVIDFPGKENLGLINISLSLSAFREVLCEDALQSTIGDNLVWSASTDTQEGAQGSG